MNQVSPYGCFPTAAANAFVYMGMDPPDIGRLIITSQCEMHKGTRDKVKLLRSLRGVHFRRATAEEVWQTAGIITFNCRRYVSHSDLFLPFGETNLCRKRQPFHRKTGGRTFLFRLQA